MKSPLRPIVKVSLTVQVPREKVDALSQALLELVAQYEAYDGGVLTQSALTFDYETEG